MDKRLIFVFFEYSNTVGRPPTSDSLTRRAAESAPTQRLADWPKIEYFNSKNILIEILFLK